MREPFGGGPGNIKEIVAYFHCGLCVATLLPGNIEAGWTEYGLQVWCKTHDVNIIHIDFMGQKHPAVTTARPRPSLPVSEQ